MYTGRNMIQIKCDQCGVEFDRQPCHVRKKNFCSMECSCLGRKKRPLKWRSIKKPRCVDCGKEIWYKSTRCGHCCKTGSHSWKWRGGVTPINTKIRFSSEYTSWKIGVITRDRHQCQSCGQIRGKLNVHHIKPFADYPELRLNADNGITLCQSCHKKTHKIVYMNAQPMVSNYFVKI